MIDVYLHPDLDHEFRSLAEVLDVVRFHPLPEDGAPHSPHVAVVRPASIEIPLPWTQEVPPLIFEETLPTDPAYLRVLIHAFTGVPYDDALVSGQAADALRLIQMIMENQMPEVDSGEIARASHAWLHNRAVAVHYTLDGSRESVMQAAELYEQALDREAPADQKAFTARLYADLLTDLEQYEGAARLLEDHLRHAQAPESQYFLRAALVQAYLEPMRPPYDRDVLRLLKADLQDILQFMRERGYQLEEAQMLKLGARINEMEALYTEALRCFTRVEQIYKEREAEYPLAMTLKEKGMLLFGWSQSGQPQFLTGALEALNKSLGHFSQEEDPMSYAEVMHYLGVLYAQFPAMPDKTGIYIARSASCFQEALKRYRDTDPQRYAMVCTNYATALHQYPEGNQLKNLQKADGLLEEALAIRTPDFPYERSLSLINLMEVRLARYELEGRPMEELKQAFEAYAQEVATLVEDEELRESARSYVDALKAY